jgi:hypothetical protein
MGRNETCSERSASFKIRASTPRPPPPVHTAASEEDEREITSWVIELIDSMTEHAATFILLSRRAFGCGIKLGMIAKLADRINSGMASCQSGRRFS